MCSLAFRSRIANRPERVTVRRSRMPCSPPELANTCEYTYRASRPRSEEHTSELQSQSNLVCRLLLEKKKKLRSIARVTHACYRSRYSFDELPAQYLSP